jgi:hypothetical protein
MVAVNVAEVPTWLDDIADAALELLGLGEAPINFTVPEDRRRHCRLLLLMVDGDDKGSPRGGLEGNFAKGSVECGEKLLGELVKRKRERVSFGCDQVPNIEGGFL